MKKIALYAFFIAMVAAVTWWADGARPPETRNLIAALILLPIFAWLIWLRRDWAPAANERRLAEKERREAARTDAPPPP